jgi:hypothetical protein
MKTESCQATSVRPQRIHTVVGFLKRNEAHFR